MSTEQHTKIKGKLSGRCWTTSDNLNISEFVVRDRRHDLGLITVNLDGLTTVAMTESDWFNLIKVILRLRWENPTGAKMVDCDGCAITLPATELIMQADPGRSVSLCSDCIQARHSKAAVTA